MALKNQYPEVRDFLGDHCLLERPSWWVCFSERVKGPLRRKRYLQKKRQEFQRAHEQSCRNLHDGGRGSYRCGHVCPRKCPGS